jgi:hypothetical protein
MPPLLSPTASASAYPERRVIVVLRVTCQPGSREFHSPGSPCECIRADRRVWKHLQTTLVTFPDISCSDPPTSYASLATVWIWLRSSCVSSILVVALKNASSSESSTSNDGSSGVGTGMGLFIWDLWKSSQRSYALPPPSWVPSNVKGRMNERDGNTRMGFWQ